MALIPGTRLGVYEITAPIGEGGMGQVYRATDTTLDRQVAIKILPDAFASDPERMARFEREAKTLASLNHPHIAAIYAVEKSAGMHALVMELVEGDDLSQRIARGAIPLDEALPIAKQIAEALEAAHERGSIHRDLKPGNIKVRSDGTVKVLDFGLAKAMEPTSSMSASASMPPTITTPAMTQAGMILGTAAYMSPEQARGTAVDKRADVWAFGVVLWEMLTGKRLFEGATVSDTLAAVLKTEPAWNALGPATPTAIRRLLRRCLEKDRKQRLDSAAAARLEIEEALTAPFAVEGVAVPAPSSASRGRLAWMVAAAAVLMVAAAAVWQQRHATTAPRPVTRFEIAVPQTDSPTSLALSPDGRQLAYVATTQGQSRVWVRLLDDTDARALVGTEGASFPFWAPNARAIGFFAEGKLKRVDLAGGASQALADAPNGRGGTWNSEGVILFTPGNATATNNVITRVSAAGGTPIAVTHLGPAEGSHRWPQFLPDGRRFIFFSTLGRSDTQGVYLGSLDGGEPIRVLATETPGVFVPPDRLLLVQGDALMAARFDAAQGTVAGELMQLAQPVGRDDGVLASAFSVAPGTLAYRATGGSQRRQLVWMDRTGKMVGSIGSPDINQLAQLALDPAGQRIAVVRTILGNFDVWLVDTSRGIPARFTFDPGGDRYPLWSADGQRVVFSSVRSGPLSLYEKSASGAGDEQLLAADAGVPLSWSPDGRFLLLQRAEPKTGIDLWVLPTTGERKSLAVVQTAMDQPGGEFSPDGRWLAYESNESGRFEVYVQPFPEAGGKWQMSSAGGTQPRWRRDGRELYYVAPDARLMAVTVAAATPDGKTLDSGVPVPLFRTPLASGAGVTAGRPEYAVAPDGRFLMNTVVDDTVPSPITVVLNWEEGLGW